VASAIDFLHGIGLVHCDLKPENLMLSAKNESASIKLVDFGGSEMLPGFDDLDLQQQQQLPSPRTRPRKTGGTTVAYCPPEALKNVDAQVDPALDMWSLGVIVYIMLTGVHPLDFDGQFVPTNRLHVMPPPI
jgi:serine/threonine protein kinase